jgi:hypothetical protein
MDVEKAIEAEIEPKLRDALGPRATSSLLTTATVAYVTAVGSQVERYRVFVDSICRDERVVQEWGKAAAAGLANEWKDLVPLAPERVVTLTSNRPD